MVSRLKMVAGLLLIAGCIRLILSCHDLYMYGTFRIPMHAQLEGPYVVLIIAVARARSERVSRWLLGYVSAQVIFTFIICYALPRTLASVLEERIPHIALAQIVGAVLVLVGAQWYDRKIITPQHLLFGLLIVLNVSTLLLLEVFRSKLEDVRQELINARQGPAMREAEGDFKAGRLRQFEVRTFRPAASAVTPPRLQSTFTGRTNGPFEIWSRPRCVSGEDEAFRLKSDMEFVSMYNGRMAFLYSMSQQQSAAQRRTNTP